MVKRAALLIAVALTSLMFWIAAMLWSADPVLALSDVQGWLWVLISLILMVAVYGIALMLIPEFSLRSLAMVMIAVPVLFIFRLHWLTASALALMLLLNMEAMRVIRNETTARTKVHIRGILGGPVSLILTSLILVVSAVYYVSPVVQEKRESKELPPSAIQMIQEVTRTFFKTEFQQIPAREQNRVVDGIIIELNEKAGPYFQYMPIALTIGLFLLLISLKFIFGWLAVSLALGLFFILQKFGFVTIAEKPVTAEQIVI
jgi:hypothetical protein